MAGSVKGRAMAGHAACARILWNPDRHALLHFPSALLCVSRERHMKTTAGERADFLMCAVTHRSQ